VQWLLSAGWASITQRDQQGHSALLYAALEGHLELVQWLLSAGGASNTERDNIGGSALLLTASHGHVAAAQWLLSAGGASIHETNTAGETVWSVLKLENMNADTDALALLLKVMVLLADAPADFVAQISPAHTDLATCG
jgi:ankyrin repeat protein